MFTLGNSYRGHGGNASQKHGRHEHAAEKQPPILAAAQPIVQAGDQGSDDRPQEQAGEEARVGDLPQGAPDSPRADGQVEPRPEFRSADLAMIGQILRPRMGVEGPQRRLHARRSLEQLVRRKDFHAFRLGRPKGLGKPIRVKRSAALAYVTVCVQPVPCSNVTGGC